MEVKTMPYVNSLDPNEFIICEVAANGKSYGFAMWCPVCGKGSDLADKCPHCGTERRKQDEDEKQ